VSNGYAEIGDIISVSEYGNAQYKVTEFGDYEGAPQIRYRRIFPETGEFYPDTIGSWMSLEDASTELRLVSQKKKFSLRNWISGR
jgi:hypothetical protein